MDQTQTSHEAFTRTLLVVEDHPAMQMMLVDWLKTTFPGYECLGTGSGERALDLARSQPLALVVMDYALPGMNGIEAARRIKQIAPNVIIIVLSMYEAEAYQVEALAAGASAYLFKRTMHTELVPVLQSLLPVLEEARAVRPAVKPAVSTSAEQARK